jgi:hypothetical protein
MFDRIFNAALRDAGISPEEFDAAIRKLKYKNRFDWFLRGAPAEIVIAYNNRVRQENENVRSA